MANIKMLFRLMGVYAMLDLRWFVQDLKNCLIVIVSDLLLTLSSISGVLLLSARFDGVGNMSSMEVLWMLAFYMLAGGTLYMMFGSNNVHQISRRVGRGQVDHMLIQPVPLWVQLGAEGFMPASGSSGFLAGLILLIYATNQLQLAITPGWICTMILLIVVHVAIQMGLSFLMATGAFYKPVSCEEISSVGSDLLNTLGRYPLFGMPEPMIWTLLTVLPAGLMAWFPSLILLGKLPASPALLLPLSVACAFIILSYTSFRKGLRHYAKNSCNRYREMGHRG